MVVSKEEQSYKSSKKFGYFYKKILENVASFFWKFCKNYLDYVAWGFFNRKMENFPPARKSLG
jgi:hypothetical protein